MFIERNVFCIFEALWVMTLITLYRAIQSLQVSFEQLKNWPEDKNVYIFKVVDFHMTSANFNLHIGLFVCRKLEYECSVIWSSDQTHLFPYAWHIPFNVSFSLIHLFSDLVQSPLNQLDKTEPEAGKKTASEVAETSSKNKEAFKLDFNFHNCTCINMMCI